MKSAQAIVDDVTEKRRQNPLYFPSLAELKAVDSVLIAQARRAGGFDLGTRPHGLSAGLAEPVQENREGSSLSLPAKPVLTLLEVSLGVKGTSGFAFDVPPARSGVDAGALSPHCAAASDSFTVAQSSHSAQRSAQGERPEAYTSPKVRSDCRCIREAAAKQAREGAHYLRLDDREYLYVYAVVEHDRNRTCKAIRKGIADPQDLKATDSLWHILQHVMVRRMKGYRL